MPRNSPERRHRFYRRVLGATADAGIPFVVGGAYAMRHYADVRRDTRDLDLFLEPERAIEAVEALSRRGFGARIVAPWWLGKVRGGDDTVDLIFRSRNGLCTVDAEWFRHSRPGRVLGVAVRWIPPEELLWSKAFVMARDRFDGADVSRLIRAQGPALDWPRLLERFGDYWEALLVHLVLFDFTFPSERGAAPDWLRRELSERWRARRPTPAPRVCRGTLLSPEEYVRDIGRRGLLDARVPPMGRLDREMLDPETLPAAPARRRARAAERTTPEARRAPRIR